jgi:hypothetical protein
MRKGTINIAFAIRVFVITPFLMASALLVGAQTSQTLCSFTNINGANPQTPARRLFNQMSEKRLNPK